MYVCVHIINACTRTHTHTCTHAGTDAHACTLRRTHIYTGLSRNLEVNLTKHKYSAHLHWNVLLFLLLNYSVFCNNIYFVNFLENNNVHSSNYGKSRIFLVSGSKSNIFSSSQAKKSVINCGDLLKHRQNILHITRLSNYKFIIFSGNWITHIVSVVIQYISIYWVIWLTLPKHDVQRKIRL